MLGKYDYLEKQILREYEHYAQDFSSTEPIKVGEYIYYRNHNNPADSLTLYRFPVQELQRYGFKRG